jgi:hypothetical protein
VTGPGTPIDPVTYVFGVLAGASLVLLVVSFVSAVRHRRPDQRPLDVWASPSGLTWAALGSTLLFAVLSGAR